MSAAIQWFLFGMFVWGCCLLMNAIAQRFAPEGGHTSRKARRRQRHRDWFGMGEEEQATPEPSDLEKEVAQLRERVATLEAIVTDRKYQWEQDLNRPQ